MIMTQEKPIVTKRDGHIYHVVNDSFHRDDGPAIIYANGDQYWYQYGLLHREGGPAVEYPDGNKEWYFDNELHRDDGPAIEYPSHQNRGKTSLVYQWCQHGRLHRIDGPAIIWSDGNQEWWYQDMTFNVDNQQDFERLLRLKVFW